MSTQDVPQYNLDLLTSRMLLVDWIRALAKIAGMELGSYGQSNEYFTFDIDHATVTATFKVEPPFLEFSCANEKLLEKVRVIALDAGARIRHGHFGETVWYSTVCEAKVQELITPFGSGAYLQQMGTHTRITGKRRLGSNVLLEFIEEFPPGADEKSGSIAPKILVRVDVPIPAPIEGFFSDGLAHTVVETVVAICTLALGRSVSLPLTVLPTPSERVLELTKYHLDEKILGLARKGVSLDIISFMLLPGGHEVFTRLRTALLTFDAAINQERDAIACLLYVVTAECLTTPEAEWRDSKLTARFLNFFEELVASDLDLLVAHANFEAVFDMQRGSRLAKSLRKDLLSKIYDYRSANVHAGLQPSYKGFGFEVGYGGQIVRRAMFCDFAEAAILRFICSPRASIVGHPKFGPPSAGSGV